MCTIGPKTTQPPMLSGFVKNVNLEDVLYMHVVSYSYILLLPGVHVVHV